MNTNTTDTYKRALKHVKDVKDFYAHLTVYGVMACFFLGLNVVTSFGDWWFYWPMFGWGIGLAIHFINVFFVDETMSIEWEEDQIKKYMGDAAYKQHKNSIDDL